VYNCRAAIRSKTQFKKGKKQVEQCYFFGVVYILCLLHIKLTMEWNIIINSIVSALFVSIELSKRVFS
jgi:hypothetical protein